MTLAFAGHGAGAAADGWQLDLQSEQTDPSGTVTFRQLQARHPGGEIVRVWLALASPAQVRCRVIVQTSRPFDSVRAAVEQNGAAAGVNGGYFKEDGSPVGLLVSGGRQWHPFEKARLLSGVFFVRAGRPYIRRLGSAPPAPLDAAIQCGPLLVERGEPVTGLNDTRVAPRTFVLQTGQGKVGIGILRATTLARTAQILQAHDFLQGDRVVIALNLDGGASTGFFGRTKDGSLDEPEWARIADCLVLSPEKADFR
ncbi:MAG: phosphodiester glycosidase family protein [Verrucomicrobia bacterium]|nr:phosphodiester glycosidase family protein [Verrucomicrobiota bacterium]